MLILGLNKTTLLDYPEHVATTIFTGGCNFTCPFCHNKDLVFADKSLRTNSVNVYQEDEILAFLKKRQNILSGVCISGGEPTLQKDLPDFISKIKALGYLVKLDTNGYSPDILASLIGKGMLDYVAMDIKNSFEKYPATTGLAMCDISRIKESISLLLSQKDTLHFEFRTTLVRELHDETDVCKMSTYIKDAPAYFLQPFKESENTISQGFHTHDCETLNHFLDVCRLNVPNTNLRG